MITSAGKDVKKSESVPTVGKCKLSQPLWKTARRFCKIINK
jgi:hypothetical protein